ncbi:PRC-barrel domain-containing protein [Leptolinea tardivitalis]|uniref:PRC-barrel domain-containing protein n=1 Tax=Leptolinea tardivitalis TaxID=229920 RepID=A0A0P6X557_9CHLR|nr:PRC-barrel domain-containing protein [Leptolinea tardivitalis]KPL75103.1 hypothetical protein ADM99_00320 [Leptolinea tardivitalis]GAP20423.1 protein containing PRC-barrel domain [Leptolinea tardivitalis]
MIASREHNGKSLISIIDGKDLGEIKGLYLDLDMRHVAGVFTGTEGLINRKALAVSRSDVNVMGIDAWLVSGSDVIHPLEEIPESSLFIPVSDLHGREIQTEGGTKLCVVDDVLIDNDGHVLGFALGKVFAQGPLAERKAIARDAITDLGSREKPMTANLSQAESLSIQTI